MELYPGPIQGVIWRPLTSDRAGRGWLGEPFRADKLPAGAPPAMACVSMTEPGVARGPREYREQADCFRRVGPSDFKGYLRDIRPVSPPTESRAWRTSLSVLRRKCCLRFTQ